MVSEFKITDWTIILGGSSGLGLASAKKMASHGMNICIVHRNRKSDLEKITVDFEEIKSYGVHFLNFNVDALRSDRQIEIIQKIKDEYPDAKIKCLIHSISKGNLKAIASGEIQLNHDDFDLTIKAMALSLYDWTKLIIDRKLFAENARIISFTSEGSSKAWKNYAAVSAAKTALEAITRSLALELAPFKITSNCIQAGVTDTVSLRMIPGNAALKEFTKKRNPFKRLTRPEDVANVVYLLCRDEASWINGAIIPVDGGEHIS